MLIGLDEKTEDIEDEHQGAWKGTPPETLSNLWMLREIIFKLGMLIGLDGRMVGIDDEQQGATLRGARGRAPKTVSTL